MTTEFNSEQNKIIKKVAEKVAEEHYKQKLDNLNSIKQEACYMIAVQKFLNEEAKHEN